MSNPKGIFSESRGIVDDAFENATDVEDAQGAGVQEKVKERFAPDGVLMLNDCTYCGLQRWSLVKWIEVSDFFLGRQVDGTQAVKAGVSMLIGCRKCGKAVPIGLTWEDVERYVNTAVRRGWLPQAIFQARAQVQAERSKRR